MTPGEIKNVGPSDEAIAAHKAKWRAEAFREAAERCAANAGGWALDASNTGDWERRRLLENMARAAQRCQADIDALASAPPPQAEPKVRPAGFILDHKSLCTQCNTYCLGEHETWCPWSKPPPTPEPKPAPDWEALARRLGGKLVEQYEHIRRLKHWHEQFYPTGNQMEVDVVKWHRERLWDIERIREEGLADFRRASGDGK
jgi:hypothetical protein